MPIGTKDQPAGAGAWSPDGKWILTGGFKTQRGCGTLRAASLGHLSQTLSPAARISRRPVSRSVPTAPEWQSASFPARFTLSLRINDFGEELKVCLKRPGRVSVLARFRPEEFQLAPGDSRTPIAQLWDIDAGTSPSMAHDRGNVLRGAFDPQGRFMVTASNDGLVRLWVLNGGPDLTPIDLRGHLGPVFSVDVSADGTIASGAGDRSVRLWGLDAPLSARRLPNATSFPVKASKIRIEKSMLVVTSEARPRYFGPGCRQTLVTWLMPR